MATISREGSLVKKVLVGLLTAGSTGVALYYGYIKWKSRSQGIPDSKKKTSAAQKTTDLELHGPERSDPTPVLQPTSPTDNRPAADSLSSVSGSFEKVSLPDQQSLSQSFEKVPIPVTNRDAPWRTTQSDGSDLVSPAGGRPQANGDLKKAEQPARSRTEMKVEMPGAVKGQPAKTGVSSVSIPKRGAGREEDEEEEDDDEDEDDDDDEEEGSDSDASGDSQVKDN